MHSTNSLLRHLPRASLPPPPPPANTRLKVFISGIVEVKPHQHQHQHLCESLCKHFSLGKKLHSMRIYFRNKNAFLLQNHSRQNYVARTLCRRINVAFIMHRGLYKCTGYAQIQVRHNAVENGNYSLYIPRKWAQLMRRVFAGRERERNGLQN